MRLFNSSLYMVKNQCFRLNIELCFKVFRSKVVILCKWNKCKKRYGGCICKYIDCLQYYSHLQGWRKFTSDSSNGNEIDYSATLMCSSKQFPAALDHWLKHVLNVIEISSRNSLSVVLKTKLVLKTMVSSNL